MKILLIEDDKYMSAFLREELTSSLNIFECAEDGKKGSYMARINNYDVIIVDYSLPCKNGIEVCKEIRESGKTTPIIFLSATASTSTKIEALDAGADDYVVKPFSYKELYSRLHALHRRPQTIAREKITIGDITIDSESQSVFRNKKRIKLTKKEFLLIEFLAKNLGRVVSRAEIMDYVWSAEIDPFSNTVEAHIRSLRKKLGKRKGKEIIRNISGRGYTLVQDNV